MTIRGVYFDFGGVLARTEDRAPRARLAESLGMSPREIEQAVFESQSAIQASLGTISEEEHWRNVLRSLHLPEGENDRFRQAFFEGEIWDQELFDFLRCLRGKLRVGLISNAWTGLRRVIASHGYEDAFDTMIISAEVGVAKPERHIYQLALQKLGLLPAEAVFVDDMPANVEGARTVGMHALQFTRTAEVLEELNRLI